MALKGIDVSEHQGVVDWNKVKGNVDFVMIRAGYGHNNIDKQFKRNISECNRLNIPCGVYWFSYAYTEQMAKNEATYCLNAIKDYRVEYPICFDFEYDSIKYMKKNGVNPSKTLNSALVVAFCEEIENAGYWAMNYANPDFLDAKFNNLNRYSLWLAWYGVSENDAKKYGCEMWQYSESGSIDGIGTHSVDMNYDYKNLGKAIRDKGLNHLGNSKPVSKPVSKPAYKLISQNGTCTVLVDKLMIREKPSTSSKAVGSYTRGESVNYDYYVDNEGYRWISWVGASGKRRYMAEKVLSTGKRYGRCV